MSSLGKYEVQSSPIDQNYLNKIYLSLTQHIQILDKLNREYKVKQEHHFLRTFMNVIEKIGNQLILAKEAYNNIDMQAKKDSYYLELAEELHFFKEESYNLNDLLTETQEELRIVKHHQESLEQEIKSIQRLYQNKTQECFYLKSQIKKLKKAIKAEININKNRVKLNNNLENEEHSLPHDSLHIKNAFENEKKNNQLNRKYASTLTREKKQGESATIESWTPSKSKRNSLALTPASTQFKPKQPTPRTFYSGSKSFRERKRLPVASHPLVDQIFNF